MNWTLPLDQLLGIAQAIGHADRAFGRLPKEVEQAWHAQDTRIDMARELRKASVLGDLPSRIHAALVRPLPTWLATKVGPTTLEVPVMELSEGEYPGPMPRRPCDIPADELTPHSLRYAGEAVFKLLSERTDLKPKVGYVYDGDTRTYSIQIVVHVQVHVSADEIAARTDSE